MTNQALPVATKVLFRKLTYVFLVFASFFCVFRFNLFKHLSDEALGSYNSDSRQLIYDSISLSNFPVHGFGLATIVPETGQVLPNQSLIGIQGYIFYGFQAIGCSTLECSRTIAIALTSIVLTSLSILLSNRVSKSLGFITFLIMISSPWVTYFAGNVYWIPFTWFLPLIVVLAFFFEEDQGRNRKLLVYFLLGASFMLKFLSGYEFTSSVILLAALPPLLNLFMRPNLNSVVIKAAYKKMVKISLTGVVAFAVTLLLHAYLRAQNVFAGLKIIWNEDVQRRTFGNPANFDPAYTPSLDASVTEVLQIYFLKWITLVISFGIPELFLITFTTISLLLLMVFLLVTILFRGAFDHGSAIQKLHKSGLALYVYAYSIPFSWFILAKSHSFIHTHINFVLWYLMSVPLFFWLTYENLTWILSKTRSRQL